MAIVQRGVFSTVLAKPSLEMREERATARLGKIAPSESLLPCPHNPARRSYTLPRNFLFTLNFFFP